MPHHRRRFFRYCQIVLTTAAVLAVAGLVLGAWWINRNGFIGQWGDKVGAELARRGVHAEFHSVRFSPVRGLLARDVVIYRDDTREEVFAEIPSLRVDIDRAEAMRGELVLRKLILSDSRLVFPLPTSEADKRHVSLEALSCKVTLDRQGRLILESGRGKIGGLEFALQAELDQFSLSTLGDAAGSEDGTGSGAFLDTVFGELQHWRFPEARPPRLQVDLQGNLAKPSSIRTTFSLAADELTRHNYGLQSVLLAGELHGRHLVVDQFEFSDGSGLLAGRVDYDLVDEEGRYEVESAIYLSRLFRDCFQRDTLEDIVPSAPPMITAHGNFARREDAPPEIGAIGTLEIPAFTFLGQGFDGLETEFSWKEGNMFLRDLSVRDSGGTLTGDVLMKDDDIRYKATSTLPAESYQPFLEKGSGLDRTIARASFNKNSRLNIEASGWIQRSRLKNWSSTGRASLRDLSFNQVPLKTAGASFTIDSKGSSFKGIEVLFDYRDYPLRNQHGGVAEALVQAEEISHNRETNLTSIVNLHGTAWPGPVLRLFAPRTAAFVERTYRTHKTPIFDASGVVDRSANRTRTDVRADIRIPGITDYRFLGKDLQLNNSTFQLRVRPQRVDVTDLAFRTFRGTGGGRVTVFNPPGSASRFEGGLKWTRLHLADIGQTYGFEKAEQGLVTGRFDFSGSQDSVRALNGQGNIGLENGHLFFVPVLGPLSAPLGEILGDKRASHEAARDASCTFAVTNGVFHTSDFLTSTPSSVFTGEGSIDLDRQTIDMTIRMNARGLLGLITLPLRPFNGLFQFRGTGGLKNPVWRNSSFTSPAKGKDDPIFRKPSRAQIVPDP